MQQTQSAIIAVAIAAMSFAPVAYAETQTVRSVSVSHGDLDLSRPEHARIMAERIDEAARWTCGGSPRFDPNYRTARASVTDRFETCRTRAVEAALAELRAPLVAQALSEHQRQG